MVAMSLLGCYYRGHRLAIHACPFSLKYTFNNFAISFGRVHVCLHFPTKHAPKWATITIYDCEHRSSGMYCSCCAECFIFHPDCHATLGRMIVTLWLFPAIFRFAQVWASVRLDDVIVRVFSSRCTPGWVQMLRRNLVSTVLLTGCDLLRLDHLKSSVAFGTKATAESDLGLPQFVFPNTVTTSKERPQDEIRLTADSDNWHIHSVTGRIYTFGKLDAQLRRSWRDDFGSFALIAKDCGWVKPPSHTRQRGIWHNPPVIW